MLSASGPWGGVVQRPSDGKHPRKVAFIQCVGSRDPSCGQGYCSAVCCMFATKEAVIAREHASEIEPTIFYIDVRAVRQGLRPLHRAGAARVRRALRAQHGLDRSRRCPAATICCLRYVDAGRTVRIVDETSSTWSCSRWGSSRRPKRRRWRSAWAWRSTATASARRSAWPPAATSRPGIFVAGPFAGPKDIPETVVEASAAAAAASALLARRRGSAWSPSAEYPPERDVSDERPRVGVFVCHCGINIGSVVDVPAVVEYAARLPDVVYAEHNLYTCSQDTQEKITADDQGAQASTAWWWPPARRARTSRSSRTPCAPPALNPHLFEMANIREQDSWVHKASRSRPPTRPKSWSTMAVAKARLRQPLRQARFAIDHRALVIGGGLAGMTAALSIADQGYAVHLVERSGELGGHLRAHLPQRSAAMTRSALLRHLRGARRAATRASLCIPRRRGGAACSGRVGEYRSTILRSRCRTALLQASWRSTTARSWWPPARRQPRPPTYGYGQRPAHHHPAASWRSSLARRPQPAGAGQLAPSS